MRNHRKRWRESACVLPIALIIINCASRTGRAQSDAGLGEVYYQVLYANKNVSDLPKVPETNKGIRSVLRIATVRPGGPLERRSRILSTRRRPVPQIPADRTLRTQLSWNGQAWVGSAADRTQQLAEIISTTKFRLATNRKPRAGRRHPLLRSLRNLQNQRAFWQLASLDIQANMFEHAGTPKAGKKRWDLAAVGVIQRNIDRSIQQHRKTLSKLARQGKLGGEFKLPDDRKVKLLHPTGKVLAAAPGGKWATADGIEKTIDEFHVLPHRLHVWAAPPKSGRRTYHVTMAHAEAGTFGAFYYVAFADLTGDGLPDTPIARSTLAQATKPGKWTSWSFTTQAKSVFIGQAWPNADNAIYYRRASEAKWRNLSREVYSAPILGALPRCPAGPYVTNCRVYSESAPLTPETQPKTKPACP